MTLVHLDTSFLIGALMAGSPEDMRLRGWLRDGVDIGVSVVAWAEFLCGPVSGEQWRGMRRVIDTPVPLTEDDARQAANLFNQRGRRRGSLPDALIAASALRARAWLATCDRDYFRGYEGAGLRVVGHA